MDFPRKSSTGQLITFLSSATPLTIRQRTSIDSVASVIFPWRNIRQRRCHIPIPAQGGREVTPMGFYLCMSSVMLLSTGISITAAALWALLYKLPYVHLAGNTTIGLGNDVLSFCVGVLSIPCFWITCTSHNTSKNYTFLPMLIALFGLCIILVITSAGMSFRFKSQIKFNHGSKPPTLISNNFQKQLNKTLLKSVLLYKENQSTVYQAWNVAQDRLKCCGSTSYTDWGTVLPNSCCRNNCTSNKIHPNGCLDKIAYDLMWGTSLTLGLSLIMFVVHMFGLCVTSWMYVANRNRDNYGY